MLSYSLISAVVFLNTAWADVSGGIATDGAMGALQTLNGANVTIPQNLGTTTSNNLFHSFAEFNIATGQIVTFTGANNLQNVFSRVTGSNVSEIEGTLKSSIANAAFYFINPNVPSELAHEWTYPARFTSVRPTKSIFLRSCLEIPLFAHKV